MILENWRLLAYVIGLIVVATIQWQKVNTNKRGIENVEERIEKMKEMFGRWQDKSEDQAQKIQKDLSELKGAFKSFFDIWKAKNGQ